MAHLMASGRLTKSQKDDLLNEYRSGLSTLLLSEKYDCSQNTVIRTVKLLLTSEEYLELKSSRSKRDLSVTVKDKNVKSINENLNKEKLIVEKIVENQEIDVDTTFDNSLALDDADDFDELVEFDTEEDISEPACDKDVNNFHEIIPLNTQFDLQDSKGIKCTKLSSTQLPESVYILVDRSVELEVRSLSEFPELVNISNHEASLKAICLYPNQRTAKRQCSRSQRVIKVPNTDVFSKSSSFLLARGITRLVLDGVVIALDE
tara:strand:- start:1926 stop:2711 length:786 start_codon:yes stop_codon:yes gene_type:complete